MWQCSEYFQQIQSGESINRSLHSCKTPGSGGYWSCHVTQHKLRVTESTGEKKDHVFEIYPPFILENLLPKPIYISVWGERDVLLEVTMSFFSHLRSRPNLWDLERA